MKLSNYVFLFVICLFLAVFFTLKSSGCFEKEDNLGGISCFKNDICLPAKLYMLSGVQNDIFIQPLIKRWRPYNDVVRFSGSVKYSRRLQSVSSIVEPEDSTFVTIDLINQDRFDTIKSITSELIAGTPGIGSDTINFSIIGDSFANGAFFKDALLGKGYIPKIQMIGLRGVRGFPGQYDEGRGGWTLEKYFRVSLDRTQAYNGFWQTEGNYKFWGATRFWELANDIRLHPEQDWTFSEIYNAGRFEKQSILFDCHSGYRLSPERNDLMFDNALNSYVEYDGDKWIEVSYGDYQWSFSYEKYLSMWNLPEPIILAVFLGLNDFRNVADPEQIDFSTWNHQMEMLKASYLNAVTGGRFVIMIPSSSCGVLDNVAGDFTTKQNACMWELRRNIIENFDNRETESIFVLDAAISIDNQYGALWTSDTTFTKPFSGYQGKEALRVQNGNPHPYINYPDMGVSLAAFIQKYR